MSIYTLVVPRDVNLPIDALLTRIGRVAMTSSKRKYVVRFCCGGLGVSDRDTKQFNRSAQPSTL